MAQDLRPGSGLGQHGRGQVTGMRPRVRRVAILRGRCDPVMARNPRQQGHRWGDDGFDACHVVRGVGDLCEVEEFATPDIKTIEALAKLEGVSRSKTAKAVFYSVDGEVVIVTIRGDYDVNETKLRNLLGGSVPRLATPEEVKAAGLVSGSASVALTQKKPYSSPC